MNQQVFQQTLTNEVVSHFKFNNLFLNLILCSIITTFIGYIFTNISVINNLCTRMIGKLQPKVYVYNVEYETYLTKVGSWSVNQEIYGFNLDLINSIYHYIESENISINNCNILLSASSSGINPYIKEHDRPRIFRPNGKIIIKNFDIELNINDTPTNKDTNISKKISITLTCKKKGQNEAFIEHCYHNFIETKYGKFKHITHEPKYLLMHYYNKSDLYFDKILIEPYKTFDNIFFPEKHKLIMNLDRLAEHKLIIPKIALLLYGPPGTGKTSVIKAVANYTNRHIQYIKLSEIKNLQDAIKIIFSDQVETRDSRGFSYATEKIPLNKRILIFEDIDVETNIVYKRDSQDNKLNKDKKNEQYENTDTHLNLSDVLQLFDGIIEIKDLIIIITTNDINKLDPALIRYGRITMKIFMGKFNIEQALNMIKYYFPSDDKYINNDFLSIRDDTLIPCVLENYCHDSENIFELKQKIEQYYKEN